LEITEAVAEGKVNSIKEVARYDRIMFSSIILLVAKCAPLLGLINDEYPWNIVVLAQILIYTVMVIAHRYVKTKHEFKHKSAILAQKRKKFNYKSLFDSVLALGEIYILVNTNLIILNVIFEVLLIVLSIEAINDFIRNFNSSFLTPSRKCLNRSAVP
jgi:Ca2+/Na+ antiporter